MKVINTYILKGEYQAYGDLRVTLRMQETFTALYACENEMYFIQSTKGIIEISKEKAYELINQHS
jgi:hypothetical protein